MFTLGNSSDAFLLVRMASWESPTRCIPLVWGTFHIVKSGGSLLAGRAVDRLGPRPLIFVGWIIYAAIYLAFSQATTAAAGCVFFLIYGVFYALTEPAERTLVANLVGPDRQGLAYRLVQLRDRRRGVAGQPDVWLDLPGARRRGGLYLERGAWRWRRS